MFDDRKAIARGTQLVFGQNSRYTVLKELGRGASCIVYNAFYEDLAGCRHIVRIKECCPYNMGIRRQDNGSLQPLPAYERRFSDAKEKFSRAYEKNVALKGMLGLMNSTVDAVNLYTYHNTLYAVNACVEGKDYREELDQDLASVFKRILALAGIIKKYHAYGVLHLDIKPENMLILPETMEHMVLFDFDSLLTKKELEEAADVRISFSDGYAAPELVHGDQDKICEASDIYSIGAVVFYKLFGRTPDVLDGSAWASYDFAQMKYQDERYQPELFQKLSDFLHRTIASSVTYRFQSVDEVRKQLEILLELSDMGRPFLYHNFSYHCAYFTGRSQELEQIHHIFASGQQVLFLSGIGGIGKTELAKRYAYEYAGQYQKIVFVHFAGSVRETVCGDDLQIHQLEQREGESAEAYFRRKIKHLKAVTSSGDLVILDNFDVENDDDLEQLFTCPCRFLVTTRGDFRDYNYEQMDVGRMEGAGELLQLFWNYYGEPDVQEEAGILSVIETVDRHTMTVELIAKYLRTAGISVDSLLNRLMQKEGIANMEQVKVRHRKDRKLLAGSIDQHLLTLFDLSGFSETECEIIRSLSLLGPVRILKHMFLKLCPAKGCADALRTLVRGGWIEYDAASGKISLHQIILDLVYDHLCPDAENCPHLIAGMTGYLQQRMPGDAKRRIRKKLFEGFFLRVSGKGLGYARLCLLYSEKISRRMEDLDLAEQICLSYACVCAEGGMSTSMELLWQIYRDKIRLASRENDLSRLLAAGRNGIGENAYFQQQSEMICSLAKKAYACAKAYSTDPAWLAGFCTDLAFELDRVLAENLWMEDIEGGEPANRILDLAVWLFDDAQQYLLDMRVPAEQKAKLYRRIQEFFGGLDFGATYRREHYGDVTRACYCQEMIEKYRQKEEPPCGELSAAELAGAALEKKDYQEAIGIYENALVQGKESYDCAWSHIAALYLEMGETGQAIRQMQKILEEDRKQIQGGNSRGVYTSHACAELIRLLMQEGRCEEARRYAQELVDYHSSFAGEERSGGHLQWLAVGSFRLYEMAASETERETYWKSCVQYYEMLPEPEELFGEMADVVLAYADHQEHTEDQIKSAFAGMERFGFLYREKATPLFLEYIIHICENESRYLQAYILALLRYSAYFMESAYGDAGQQDQALAYWKKAERLYDGAGMRNAYLESLICRIQAEWYAGCGGDVDFEKITDLKRKCNYYLLAACDGTGRTEEEQIRIWEKAAGEYHFLEDYAMEERCFAKMFEILMPLITESGQQECRYGRVSFYEYATLASGWIRCGLKLGNRMQVREKAWELYDRAVAYYMHIHEGKDFRKKMDECRLQAVGCADMLLAAGLRREALLLYMAAAILAVDEDPDERLLRDRKVYDGGSPDRWKAVFCRLLHGNITEQDVDTVVDIYEKLQPFLETDTGFGGLAEELAWFSRTYQYRDVEFKRDLRNKNSK